VVGDQRRHIRLTGRDHQVPHRQFSVHKTEPPSHKHCALTHRWMTREYPNSSTRQSPTVSPSSSQVHFYQSDALTVDVEVKVDALTKLQAELETGVEVHP